MKPRIVYLSEAEVGRIHQAALELLSERGMKLPSPEALSLLSDAGATIKGEVALIPAELVGRSLEQTPKRDGFVLFGRTPEHDINIVRDGPIIASMTEATHIIDPLTGDRRPATNSDLETLTQFINHLDHVEVNSPPVTPQDVARGLSDWYTWATGIKNTEKHIIGAGPGAESVRDVALMASAAVGGERRFRERPFVSFWVLTRPPLEVDPLTLEALIECSRWGIPVIISSGPIQGMTAPVTLPGMAAMAHAEILSCIVLSQLARPGSPVVYTSFARGMDMRSGAVSMSSPEFAILKVMMSQLGRSLNLPVSMPGMLRDAKMLDAQAGFETGMTGAFSAVSADIVVGMQFDMDIHVEYGDLVFCNEVMGAFRRLAREMVVDDGTLALSVIKDVGPGGTFLSHDHTFRRFKDEMWQPELLERRMWVKWERDGRKDIGDIMHQRALDILGRSPIQTLPDGAAAEIDRIVAKASQSFATE